MESRSTETCPVNATTWAAAAAPPATAAELVGGAAEGGCGFNDGSCAKHTPAPTAASSHVRAALLCVTAITPPQPVGPAEALISKTQVYTKVASQSQRQPQFFRSYKRLR
jgi:hypothetical protein